MEKELEEIKKKAIEFIEGLPHADAPHDNIEKKVVVEIGNYMLINKTDFIRDELKNMDEGTRLMSTVLAHNKVTDLMNKGMYDGFTTSEYMGSIWINLRKHYRDNPEDSITPYHLAIALSELIIDAGNLDNLKEKMSKDIDPELKAEIEKHNNDVNNYGKVLVKFVHDVGEFMLNHGRDKNTDTVSTEELGKHIYEKKEKVYKLFSTIEEINPGNFKSTVAAYNDYCKDFSEEDCYNALGNCCTDILDISPDFNNKKAVSTLISFGVALYTFVKRLESL